MPEQHDDHPALMLRLTLMAGNDDETQGNPSSQLADRAQFAFIHSHWMFCFHLSAKFLKSLVSDMLHPHSSTDFLSIFMDLTDLIVKLPPYSLTHTFSQYTRIRFESHFLSSIPDIRMIFHTHTYSTYLLIVRDFVTIDRLILINQTSLSYKAQKKD